VKFLCLDCDEPMKLHSTEGPDAGSLTVTFRCPACGFRVAMLTNPFETQMVKSLGVKIGGGDAPPGPFEHVRASIANVRPDAFEGAPAEPPAAVTPGASGTEGTGSGCPFAALVNANAAPPPAALVWTPEAESRMERIPAFIRPMARKAIERYAEDKGYTSVTDAVLDEARAAFGV
jgi:DNA-directed RNA polymerase subunit RPC12/RpoP